ncbi:MAG: hypothetical protein OWU84_05890 [Firmicutes bacterium]|nr:hypothetical protein [Bacillota bacterium]
MLPQNNEKSTLSFFFRKFGMGRLLAQTGVRFHTVGIPGTALLQFLVALICTERNFWRWFEEARAQHGKVLPIEKSTVYAFLKSPHINWRRVLLALSVRTTQWVHRFSASRDAVFIVETPSLIGIGVATSISSPKCTITWSSAFGGDFGGSR